tara:strand:+ start:91 stop:507 length:417 start_codon:yes stop_codon:yes gene_type:complete
MDLIKPRTTIIGKASYVPILNTRDGRENSGSSEIMEDTLVSDQARYIETRPVSDHRMETRKDFNRMTQLQDGKLSEEVSDSFRVSKVKPGLQSIRPYYPDSVLEPRWTGTVLVPNTMQYATKNIGDDFKEDINIFRFN